MKKTIKNNKTHEEILELFVRRVNDAYEFFEVYPNEDGNIDEDLIHVEMLMPHSGYSLTNYMKREFVTRLVVQGFKHYYKENFGKLPKSTEEQLPQVLTNLINLRNNGSNRQNCKSKPLV